MLNTPFAKTFMLLAVSAVIVAAFIYRAAEPRYGVPDEKNRVRHPAGFSMVQPRDWTTNPIELYVGDLSKEYVLSFFESRSEVLPAEIAVKRLTQRPTDLPAEPPKLIAGRQAYQTVKTRMRYTDTLLWFEDSGFWYRVGMSVPRDATADDLLPYVATLRSESPQITPATNTTQPMIAPTTVIP